MKSANNDGPDKAYFPYSGTLGNVGIILFGPFLPLITGKLTGQENLSFLAFWLSRFIDLPLCLIADTVLLPGTLPYYIYVKSGRPWSSDWYHGKYEQRVTSFRDQNPPYNALKSILASNDLAALQRFLKLYDVVALEKKINFLQQEDLLPYEHSWSYDFYSHKIGIIDYTASFFSTQTAYRNIVPKTFNPGDRLEIVYALYEEFRKDPILEKRYYDTVWKTCLSSGVLIHNPKILKKVVLEFSGRKEIYNLFESIVQKYPQKEYNNSSPVKIISYQYQQDGKEYKYYDVDRSKVKVPPQISERWYERIDLLTEMDDLLQKNPELLKEWRRTAWISAISSGVIVHRPLILEKAFREFPIETTKWGLNLFIEAHENKIRQSIDIIAKNLTDVKNFSTDRLKEKTIQNVLEYPNIVKRLLQNNWNPNSIFSYEKSTFTLRDTVTVTGESSLLILSLEEDSVPAETSRILLEYGANPDLPVKRKSIQEYLLYPSASIDPNNGNEAVRKLKQKILIDWKK
ncbi:YceK/YidQ family lipoprotein [Leptospira weilii]|nr:YceK/YidQ family lipoprotein [Leptospira weilii]